MTLSEWSDVFKILAVVISFFGILVSLHYTRKTLKEVQRDRELNHLPFLYFEPGGFRYRVIFEKIGLRIPGIEPSSAEKILEHLPRDGESVLVFQKIDFEGKIENIVEIGRLKNYGVGTAFSVQVSWIPRKVYFGVSSFDVENASDDPLYAYSCNTMPCHKSNLAPMEITGAVRLPLFIEKDFEKKLTRVDGVIVILCKDIFGNTHKKEQQFYLFTGYRQQSMGDQEKPYVHITYLDI